MPGHLRALKEIGITAGKANEALAETASAERMTINADRDFRRVTNPSRHPAELARQMDRVREFQAEAAVQTRQADAANAEIRLLFARDLVLFPTATAGGTALMAAAPPGVALTAAQNSVTRTLLKSIAPEKGMPKDSRMVFVLSATPVKIDRDARALRLG